MVTRVFVEKKQGFNIEAQQMLADLKGNLGLRGLEEVRILNRYDVSGLSEEQFGAAARTILSEPTMDAVYGEDFRLPGEYQVFAMEYLPGQYDQRADSAAQCVQLLTQGERPAVATAKVIGLKGQVSAEEFEKVKHYLINPVESREASMEKPATLEMQADVPADVARVTGFTTWDKARMQAYFDSMGFAMTLSDLEFCRDYFRDEEHRDPTVTELRVIDTYWSDHCRHTTFLTRLNKIDVEKGALSQAVEKALRDYLALREELYAGRDKPVSLMDMATIGAKYLRKKGLVPDLDESEEINACSIEAPVTIDGKTETWLIQFKNETHNHPTEIEPFGGAATCIGGCIRDPLSGRAYVHQAMRVTGAGDPRASLDQTLSGKLPQRKLCQTAAAGYSSYGNQIGLATGHVAELYHEGYIAKRLECGAVVAAAPAYNVRRECPVPGDVVILLGGRTGRDGIGGATGSSKSHNLKSLSTMASEVQKGNAPEERKIQRLFRDSAVTRLIKRCNDFGAGGVSVAIGELADGLRIDLDAVRKKYDGLDGTELAISESQERMAVVVAPEDVDTFIAAAEAENLEAYRVAVVTEEARMVMEWNGTVIADLSRDFLNTNGAVKHAGVRVAEKDRTALAKPRFQSLREMASSLKCASRRGLVERFDSTIGAGSILMPFGGRTQRTPAQAMAAVFPVLPGQETDQASVMAWGCDPEQTCTAPYTGAYNAVYTSMAKLVAAGADYKKAYLSFQEFFEKLRNEPERWGKPFSALLGTVDAQLELGAAAIGGKDSMSGTFLDLDVPPTLISFAIAPLKTGEVLSPEFKEAGHPVYLFSGTDADSVKAAWERLHDLALAGKVRAAWAVENGLAEGVMKMSFGNEIGFATENADLDWNTLYPGAIAAELTEDTTEAVRLGVTTAEPVVRIAGDSAPISELLALNEGVLESVYPSRTIADPAEVPVLSAPAAPRTAPKAGVAVPKVLIPVFPGTNCEYDSARAVQRAGLEPEILVLNNQSAQGVADSISRFAKAARNSQIIFVPGGFSGGDEPDGSAKFITAFFRNPEVRDATMDLLKNRDGLMLGICNGFQALIKLGLVPYGEIIDTDETCPTLTFNTISRHQSRLVRTRIASNRSPWLAGTQVGDIYTVPISHGEGRFLCSEELVRKLADNGQIVTQYVDEHGVPGMDVDVNPNGSIWAVEGIMSPDGRVLGKMGHSERVADGLYKNVDGCYDMKLFQSAKKYFDI